MHGNFIIWPYTRKKSFIFITFLGFVWWKKLISPCNKTTKIGLRDVCQTHP